MKTQNADFGLDFVLFLAKIHLANGLTPKMVKKIWWAGEYHIGINVDNTMFKMGTIILVSRSALAVYFD